MKRSDLIDVIYCAQGSMNRVIENWEMGDLAAAVRELQAVLNEEVTPAIEWWESDNA